MHNKRSLRQVVVAIMLFAAFLVQGTWALAGTTGGLAGQVTDAHGTPVAGAAVKVSSPSETASATTDATGHFQFLSLAPDSYTVTVDKSGYNTTSYAGVTVFADQSQTLTIALSTALKTIAHITSRAPGNLVKPGTTSDVYSVNEASTNAQQAAGGGYNLNSAYGALYNTPGVQGFIGNYGFGQVYYIRGSAYSQVGYEFDGVPVNRAFDNYNANSLSTLGQQELQVYTGGSPAGASSATLGGFINQVIKTGTYPGNAYATLGIGAPTFYHSAKIEVGGSTPDRMFSYYAALSGYNSNYHFENNQDAGNFASDGNNAIGASGSIGYNSSFGLSSTRGPWATCLANGNAPPGAGDVFGFPNCNAYFPTTTGLNLVGPFYIQDRESIVNLHFGIQHRNDAGRDDVQVLFDNFSVPQYYQNNVNAVGGVAGINADLAPLQRVLGLFGPVLPGGSGIGNICSVMSSGFMTFDALTGGTIPCIRGGASPFPYGDSYIFGPGTQFGQLADTAKVIPYAFPYTGGGRAQFGAIPAALQDGIWNDGSIIKLQYQKNIGDSAYLRIFGYTFYSDWLQSAPFETSMGVANLFGVPQNNIVSPNYELSTHTKGLELQFSDQLNDQNLLTFTGNYTTAAVTRWNNYTPYQSMALETGALNLDQPTNFAASGGRCFDASTGAADSCFSGSTQGTYHAPDGPYSTSDPCGAGLLPKTSAACIAGAKFIVTVPGDMGLRNAVQPNFYSTSLTDELRPNDKLDINLGIRFEDYEYNLENTNTPSNQFWFAAAANTYCYDPGTGLALLTPITPTNPTQSPAQLPNTLPGQSAGQCYVPGTLTPYTGPSGKVALHPNGVNGNLLFTPNGPATFNHSLWSPRIGFTYTVDPNTVLRATYGRYTQPTETAFEQYTGPSGVFVSNFLFSHFWDLGFNTPAHNNPVQVSNNYDFSLEHHLKGTDWTFKISPYYRYTTNQLISVSLGGNFASGINAATQQSSGVEVAIQKGDPSRNGLSGQLSYTYSSVKQKYATLSNGSNAIININNYIAAFNALTKGGGGAPCYNPGSRSPVNGAAAPVNNPALCGQAAAGAAGYIVNPYYNDPVQGTLDKNAWYSAYVNNPPSSVGAGDTTQNSPNQFAGFLSWKRNKFSVTLDPILQEGTRFGSPFDFVGYDPRFCGGNQAKVPNTDTPGNADYQSCGTSAFTSSGSLAVPNPLTGRFSGMGQYRNPWEFNLGLQLTYQLNPRMTATAVLANVVNTCFGGTQPPGTTFAPSSYVCGWNANGSYISDYYYGSSPNQAANGTAGYPAWLNQPYGTVLNGLPFQAYINLQVKL